MLVLILRPYLRTGIEPVFPPYRGGVRPLDYRVGLCRLATALDIDLLLCSFDPLIELCELFLFSLLGLFASDFVVSV